MITLFQTIMTLVLKIMESLFHLSQSISNIIKVLFIITSGKAENLLQNMDSIKLIKY